MVTLREAATAFNAAASDPACRVGGKERGNLLAGLSFMPPEIRDLMPIDAGAEAIVSFVRGYRDLDGAGSQGIAGISGMPAAAAPARTVQMVDVALQTTAELAQPLLEQPRMAADNQSRRDGPNWPELERKWAGTTNDWPELERQWAAIIDAVPQATKVRWLWGILVHLVIVGLCAWNWGAAAGAAPVVLAVLWLLGLRYHRTAVAAARTAWTAGLAAWRAGGGWTRWWAWPWLLVWILLTTGIGIVACLGEYWPLAGALCFYAVKVLRPVLRCHLPPAEPTAYLFWLIATIRSRAGISLVSWPFLKLAQERGARVLTASFAWPPTWQRRW